MKSYLFLLFIAFITCQSLDKNNEIVLKASEIVNETFEKIASFFAECNLDEDCIIEKLYYYVSTLSYEEYLEVENFLSTNECKDFCIEKLSEKVDKEVSLSYCSNACYE